MNVSSWSGTLLRIGASLPLTLLIGFGFYVTCGEWVNYEECSLENLELHKLAKGWKTSLLSSR
jgi:hypothetical protein